MDRRDVPRLRGLDGRVGRVRVLRAVRRSTAIRTPVGQWRRRRSAGRHLPRRRSVETLPIARPAAGSTGRSTGSSSISRRGTTDSGVVSTVNNGPNIDCLETPDLPFSPIDESISFVHRRPEIEWQHNFPQTRVPTFDDEGTAGFTSLGGPDASVAGMPFAGNSVTGGIVIDDPRWPSEWRGMLFADYIFGWMRYARLDEEGMPVEILPFDNTAGPIVDRARPGLGRRDRGPIRPEPDAVHAPEVALPRRSRRRRPGRGRRSRTAALRVEPSGSGRPRRQRHRGRRRPGPPPSRRGASAPETAAPNGHPSRSESMPMLMVMRHAKSSWSDATTADHDRPLNTRGRSRRGRHRAVRGEERTSFPTSSWPATVAERERQGNCGPTPRTGTDPWTTSRALPRFRAAGLLAGRAPLRAEMAGADRVMLVARTPASRISSGTVCDDLVTVPTGTLAVMEHASDDLDPSSLRLVGIQLTRDLVD